MSKVETIDLGGNMLTGALPSELPRSLRLFNVSHNPALFAGRSQVSFSFEALRILNVSNTGMDLVQLRGVQLAEPALIVLTGNSFVCPYPAALGSGSVISPASPACLMDWSIAWAFWGTITAVVAIVVLVRLVLKSIATPVQGDADPGETESSAAARRAVVALVIWQVMSWVDTFGDVFVTTSMTSSIVEQPDVCNAAGQSNVFVPYFYRAGTTERFGNQSFTFQEYIDSSIELPEASFAIEVNTNSSSSKTFLLPVWVKTRPSSRAEILLNQPAETPGLNAIVANTVRFKELCQQFEGAGCKFDLSEPSVCFREAVPNMWFVYLCWATLCSIAIIELVKTV
mmetsp:Transcript_18707/g.36605  ORF Transcript_18707/g.36605 Transcript_18707/m.36605 type:complete len:342 (+) Transcript_18707:846-1871(+)